MTMTMTDKDNKYDNEDDNNDENNNDSTYSACAPVCLCVCDYNYNLSTLLCFVYICKFEYMQTKQSKNCWYIKVCCGIKSK